MSSPCYGRIVWVAIPDSLSGENYEDHPAVIITPTDQIQPDGEVVVVGISTKKGLAPADHQVDLPWHAQGMNRTGLKKPCSAVGSWVQRIHLRDVRRYGGTVPGAEMIRINQLVRQLRQQATSDAETPTLPPATEE